MAEVILHASVKTSRINYADVPHAYWPNATFFPDGHKGPAKDCISAVCRSMADCNELVKFFDNQPNFCPDLPVLLLIPGNPTLVSGMGFATVAELRDCCIEVWGVKTGSDAHKRFDGNEIREQLGMARREDVAEMTREAFFERRLRHKASPITDPVRQYQYPNPTGKTVHSVPDSQDWKE